jgi:DNA-binding transcriptional LysR family regulator
LRVAHTKSFSAVAAERGVTQPAVSRQLSALEEHLGTRLVQRSTQAVTLTDEGRTLLGPARELVEAADALLDSAKHRRGTPVGLVRIAVSVPLGLYLASFITKLLDEHQELSVELVLRDRYGNLQEDGLDAEVRVGERSDSSLISRRVGSTSQWVVASPAYLKRTSVPVQPQELEVHNCIVHHKEGSDDVWWFTEAGGKDPKEEIAVNVHGRFSANNAAAVHRAALAGQGIACLSHLIVQDDVNAGTLVRLLEHYQPRRHPIYIDYPARNLPPRVKAVIDFLQQHAKDDTRFLP